MEKEKISLIKGHSDTLIPKIMKIFALAYVVLYGIASVGALAYSYGQGEWAFQLFGFWGNAMAALFGGLVLFALAEIVDLLTYAFRQRREDGGDDL